MGSETRDTIVRLGKLNIKILLGIAALALVCKLVVFWMSVASSMTFSIPNAENWQDFYLAYVPAVNTLRAGLLPFRDFYYPYPAPFLYALTMFSFLPLPSWSSALPLVIADALTVVPVYLIARELVGERYSTAISILFILAPTNLYYVDYLWLNPSLTTLFLMFSIYLLIKRRYGLSALALALSIGLKQTALFALPVVLLIMRKEKSGRTESLKYLLITASLCLLFSVPYIIVSPGLYLGSIFRLPFGLWYAGQLQPSYFQLAVGSGTRVSWDTSNWITSKLFFNLSAAGYPVTLALPLFIFLIPTTFAWVYTYFLHPYGLEIVLLGGYAFLLNRIRKKAVVDDRGSLNYVLYALLLLFTFYPLYKYYVVGIVPLLVLLVRSKKDAIGFATFNFVLMFLPSYLGSWVLLVTLLWLLRRQLLGRFQIGPFRALRPPAQTD